MTRNGISVVPRTLRGQIALVAAGFAFVPFVGLLVMVAQSLGRSTLPVAVSAIALTAAVVGVAALCLTAGSVFARYVTAPLHSLLLELRHPRMRQGVSVRQVSIEATDPDEVRDLKRSVNDVLTRVESEAGQRQAVFAMLAHDMKNPILGTVRVLEQAQRGGIPEEQWLEHVLDEQRRLLEAVTLIVQAAKYERGDVAFERARVDLKVVVDRVIQRSQRRVGVTVSSSGACQVIGDEGQIERLVENLLVNAVRCARSQVRVELYPGVLRVSDDGPGLPSSFAELTSPFRSESLVVDGVATPTGMAGLGLYIVQRIVESHGGRLTVESTGSTGTTILAYLPG